jgi:CRP/FNR family transcriptional regulator, cyclic AMP receptor protein
MSTRVTRWTDVEERARAISSVAPFTAWPAQALRRLAEASAVERHRRGAAILSRGAHLDSVVVVVEGHVQIALSSPDGRGVVFVIARPLAGVFGLGSVVGGFVMANDVVADEPTTSVAIPIAAVRAELARTPALWESIAAEIAARAHYAIEQLTIVLFKPLRARLARLLVALAASNGAQREDGAVSIDLRLPQERVGDMLGVSRQTAAALVRELVREGLVQWRYGRATLLDAPRLRELASHEFDGPALGTPADPAARG